MKLLVDMNLSPHWCEALGAARILLRFELELSQGAIVTVDRARSRVRLLPLR